MWPKDWNDQDASRYGGKPHPGNSVLDGHPAPLPEKGHTPSSRSMCIVATRLPISATAKHLLYQHVWSGTLVPRERYGGAVYTPGRRRPNGIGTASQRQAFQCLQSAQDTDVERLQYCCVCRRAGHSAAARASSGRRRGTAGRSEALVRLSSLAGRLV